LASFALNALRISAWVATLVLVPANLVSGEMVGTFLPAGLAAGAGFAPGAGLAPLATTGLEFADLEGAAAGFFGAGFAVGVAFFATGFTTLAGTTFLGAGFAATGFAAFFAGTAFL